MSSEPFSAEPVLNGKFRQDLARTGDSGLLAFRSPDEPGWCPGCGYHGVQLALATALARRGIRPENLVLVGGGGCAGYFPFYMAGHGLQAGPGLALPVAEGVRWTRPGLTVLAVLGDGDALGPGLNHLLQAVRRDTPLTVLMLNNGLCGQTRGLASPATPGVRAGRAGKLPAAGNPLAVIPLALAAGIRYAARGWAGDPEGLAGLLAAGLGRSGCSLVEALAPCFTYGSKIMSYQELRGQVRPLPRDHDASSREQAAARAAAVPPWLGVFCHFEAGSAGPRTVLESPPE